MHCAPHLHVDACISASVIIYLLRLLARSASRIDSLLSERTKTTSDAVPLLNVLMEKPMSLPSRLHLVQVIVCGNTSRRSCGIIVPHVSQLRFIVALMRWRRDSHADCGCGGNLSDIVPLTVTQLHFPLL